MKTLGIASVLVVALTAGCTTLDSSTVIRGDLIESKEIGDEYLLSQNLGVEAKSIASVEVYLDSTYAQDYEESYQRHKHNKYKTKSLSIGTVLGGAAYGGLMGWLIDASCDDEVDDCDSSYAGAAAIGGALVGLLWSALDPDVSYKDSREKMPPEVELKQRKKTRKQPLPNELISVSYNSTKLFDRKTNSAGRIAIGEQELIDGGVHPLAIAFLDKVELSMSAAGKSKTVNVPLSASDRVISSRLVSQEMGDFLRGTSFRKLMSSSLIPMRMTYRGQTKSHNIDVSKLDESFYRKHYEYHREQLSKEFGPRLSNCQALSENFKEIYECLYAVGRD
jgi:Zn-finger nucleic acid-binding protein